MYLRILYYCISICRSYYSKHHSLHSYSIAFLWRSKVLLHTCTVWMDLSLSILHLYLQRYFFSIMIFISYSYSPEGNMKNYILKQESLLTLNFCTVFNRWLLLGINDSLKKYISAATMKFVCLYLVKITRRITWIFCMGLPYDCSPLRNLCKVKWGSHQLHIIIMI